MREVHGVKVVLWGTYDTGKPRVRILRDGLRENGVEVIECHANVWQGVEDKSQLVGVRRKCQLVWRWLSSYPGLLWRYLRLPAHDLVLVSYPGMLDVLLIRLLALFRGVPVAWDVFISVYDTVVEDRRLLSARNPLAIMLWAGEWLAFRATRYAFMDTQAHARRIEQLFHLPDGYCGAIWVGVEADKFPQLPSRARSNQDECLVLFYGQFIPLHGIEHIVTAAYLLKDRPVHWVLIGMGQEAPRIRLLLDRRPVPSLEWIEWVNYEELSGWMDRADVCLGIFGTSAKAASVIPNKVFQILASGKPLITRDSLAIRELVDEDSACVSLVEPGNSLALAAAVERFVAMRCPGVCHDTVRARIGPPAIGRQWHELMSRASQMERH